MNKRYIDFVPTKKGATKGAATGKQTVPLGAAVTLKQTARVDVGVGKSEARKVAEKTAARRAAARMTRAEQTQDDLPLEEMFAERAQPAGVSKGLKEPKFGVIEDYQPKFVQAEVKKRPLGARRTAASISTAVPQPDKPKVAQAAKKALKTPKPAFVNTEKVEKRPLSRAAHPKKTVTGSKAATAGGAGLSSAKSAASGTKSAASGLKLGAKKNVYTKKFVENTKKADKKSDEPVRIIDKPEKDSRAGLIIAVILTIILGAAAGTVAFLLLPK